MADQQPAYQFSIWLRNRQRERWGWVYILVLLAAGVPVISILLVLFTTPQGFFISLIPVVICFVWGTIIFTKWSSDVAIIIIETASILIDKQTNGEHALIAFENVKDYNYTSFKGTSSLQLMMRNGSELLLVSDYGFKAFSKMAKQFELSYRAHMWQNYVPQPRRR